MAGRPPPVHPPLPASISVKLLSIPRRVPIDALLITNDDKIFLAITGALRDLRKVLLSTKLGYVFLGEIGKNTVFMLNACGSQARGVIDFLQPRLIIWLGFCVSKSYRPGDVLVSDEVICKGVAGQQVRLTGSSLLAQLFHDGRFGWAPPTATEQRVHRGEILHVAASEAYSQKLLKSRDPSDTVATTPAKALDFLRTFDQGKQEWLALYGVLGTKNCEATWAPYVAMVMSSFVRQVLQDDAIFSTFEVEDDRTRNLLPVASLPCRRSPIQESVTSHGAFPGSAHSGVNQHKRATALSSPSLESQSPSIWKDVSTPNFVLEVKTKTPVENSCLPACATSAPDTRHRRYHRSLRHMTHKAAAGSGRVQAANMHRQYFGNCNGSETLISRIFAPKKSSVHLGLEHAFDTVLPPVVTTGDY